MFFVQSLIFEKEYSDWDLTTVSVTSVNKILKELTPDTLRRALNFPTNCNEEKQNQIIEQIIKDEYYFGELTGFIDSRIFVTEIEDLDDLNLQGSFNYYSTIYR